MITNEIMCLMGFGIMGFIIYSLYQCINDRFDILRIANEEHKRRINFLNDMVKDGLQGSANCCKAGMEAIRKELSELDTKVKQKDAYETRILYDERFLNMHKIENRLRRCEISLFSSESQNERGERVISVIVQDPEDVPCASEPLGNSGCAPEPKDFEPKPKQKMKQNGNK